MTSPLAVTDGLFFERAGASLDLDSARRQVSRAASGTW